VGGRKDPVWRIVVADQRSPRDGRVIETIGHYNAQTQPSTIVLDEARARTWIERGAQPSKAVTKLLRIRESGETLAAEDGEDAAREAASESTETTAAPAAEVAGGENTDAEPADADATGGGAADAEDADADAASGETGGASA
jgi:small subunit ribosomal protein S16